MDRREHHDASALKLGLCLLTAVTAIAALPAGAAAQSAGPNLPVVVVDGPQRIVNEPKRDAAMRVFDGQRNEDYSGPVGIELRGRSSRDDPKKSYGFETRDESGKREDASLLGMPEDDDWVLIAGYKDESLLRNFVAYSAGRWLGRYAPRTRLVELVLNDEYEGVYLLAEKLELHEKRVVADDSDISGGYLLQMVSPDRSGREGRFFTTPVRRQPVVYADPKGDDISLGRAKWIRDYVNRFERRLYGKRFTHPRRGYRPYLGISAAVDFVLLNELFRNADTFTYSTYMHKGTGGKLALGPLWDFDHAVGNYERRGADAEPNRVDGWQYGASAWCERLYRDPAFRERMATRWRELRKRGLRGEVMRTIDSGAGQLAAAQERNFSRWPVFGTDAAYPDDPRTGAPPASHAEAVNYLKWWLRNRISWIDENVNKLRP